VTPERGSRDTPTRRALVRESLDRDLGRYARRERDASSFWRSLGVLGSVGWPIVLAAVGGALAGRWLDARYDSGIRFTLGLLTAGVSVGVAVAWHLVRPER
jgi:ATP synthase protein I